MDLGTTLIPTCDGSFTLKNDKFGETYHSHFGAMSESLCVFINAGLRYWVDNNDKTNINVFEMGFGSGLNAVLALQFAEENKRKIFYHAIEKFPVDEDTLIALNHANLVLKYRNDAKKLIACEWNDTIAISEYFTIKKEVVDIEFIDFSTTYDVIFYDAFSPNVQPELWTETILKKIAYLCNNCAVMTTYCVKGEVRRILAKCGFRVEKIPGPKGKREITRAILNNRHPKKN